MSALWRREEFLRICSKEELAEKAQDIEVTIPVTKNQETRYNQRDTLSEATEVLRTVVTFVVGTEFLV